MRDVIAKDLWDAQQSAHAQVIDLQTGKEAATQVGSLLLTASLSTAVNAVKGLTREEMVECLVSPLREPSDFLAAFEELEKVAWYLHHTPEGRYYFDRQENLTKLLQSLAHDAPENQVDDLIRHRLREMFKPTRKTGYEDVLPLPRLEEVADRVRKGRVLLIVSPDSKIPPEEVQKFFEGLSQKNNLCVLTGDKTAMGSVEKAARQLFAAQKADGRIPKGHPQREDLERKQQTYEQDFNSTILNLFDKVLFPIQRAGRPPQLASKALDMTRDATKPFNGEEQIEKTLTSNPLKLYLDVEKEFDAIRDKAQDLLWPENQDEARWSDVADRYAEQAGMPWLPPKGLDTLKSIACNRGLWEDLGNGYVTKKPKKKRTSVQVIAESEPDDEGKVRLRVNPQNAGPAPRIHYAEDAPVSESSPQLKDQSLHHGRAAGELPGVRPVRPVRDRRSGDLVQQARPAQPALREGRQAQRRTLRRAPGDDPLHARRQRTARRHAPTKARSPSATARFCCAPSPRRTGSRPRPSFDPAQIFGEILTLLEDSKRSRDEAIELAYRREPSERVYVPRNLYVIGTMNIADRSLALVDLALRRRFAFVNLEPQLNALWRAWCTDRCNLSAEVVSMIEQRMNALNGEIDQDRSLGPQYRIGHSYVTPLAGVPVDDGHAWFSGVVQTEIIPLLAEYWFDAPDKVRAAAHKLLENA